MSVMISQQVLSIWNMGDLLKVRRCITSDLAQPYGETALHFRLNGMLSLAFVFLCNR